MAEHTEAANESEAEIGGSPPSEPSAAALALALGQGSRDKAVNTETAAFLRDQRRMIGLQMEHLHEQRELQLSRLRWGRFNDRIKAALQLMTGVIGMAIAVALGAAVWDATRSDSVVVAAFHTPPGVASQGLDGTVVASGLLDELQRLQDASRASIEKRGLKDAWSGDIKLDLPETGVSIGEVVRLLHAWLGHETHISGDLVQSGLGLALTVRGDGMEAKTFSGPDLKTLTTQAAEYIYGQSEPYAFATYLTDVGRDADAVMFAKAIMPAIKPSERPYLLNAWANGLIDLGRFREVEAKHHEAVRLKPDFWTAWANVVNDRWILQDEEGAWRATLQFERLSHRGASGSKINPSLYENGDFFRQDWSAALAEVLKDAQLNNGGGTGSAQAAPVLAGVAVQMHDPAQSELFLQTMQDADKDPFAVAMTHFVHGWAASDRGDWSDAARELEMFAAGYTNPLVGTQFPGSDCWLIPAEEMAGHPDKADAAVKAGGHYVDCYRFKADILDHRGDWPGTQKAYADAVALAPDLPAAWYSWGLALARHGDLAGAEAKYAAAYQRGPHWADPLKAWGDALATQHRLAEAEAKYAEAVRYAPKWTQLHMAYANALKTDGKYRDAIAQYRAVTEAAGHG